MENSERHLVHWPFPVFDGIHPQDWVLDLGAGGEGLEPSLERKGVRYLALDILTVPGVDVVGDGQNLPFRDESFHAVVSFATLEHVLNPPLMVQEVFRVLKNGGWFKGSAAFLEPYHNSYYHMSHKALVYLLESNGFKQVQIWPGWHALEAVGLGFFLGFRWVGWISRGLVFFRKWILSVLRGPEYAREDILRLAGSYYFMGQKG
ncbi:MAG: class I SAM-dependent methyltransferase [Elusimicrobia bacterium]|nr:class I SAM-dependent methyltransferase [Elusimicrobiota bacterium]